MFIWISTRKARWPNNETQEGSRSCVGEKAQAINTKCNCDYEWLTCFLLCYMHERMVFSYGRFILCFEKDAGKRSSSVLRAACKTFFLACEATAYSRCQLVNLITIALVNEK